MKSSLKGFTILEALLSLIILSLIIGLTYSIVNMFNRQMSLFEKENTAIMEYNLFNKTLLYDINQSNDYEASENAISLKYYNKTDINYIFKSDIVIRQTLTSTDTLLIPIVSYKLPNNTNQISNTIHLKLNLLGNTFNANYVIKCSNSRLINNTFFNEN